MPRTDICEYLTHFTKDDKVTGKSAFKQLQIIMESRFLLGTSSFIRGGYKCVCFSEAPVEQMPNGLVNPDYYSKYSPFGIIVSKAWLYEKGGRPVIYQSDSEFEMLPESHRWRHVLYAPGVTDFTWEREWRIKVERLKITPSVAFVVVPDIYWAQELLKLQAKKVRRDIEAYSTFFEREKETKLYRKLARLWRVLFLR